MGDYSEMDVEQLKDELRDRDLPVSGKKDELVSRLEADDRGESNFDPEGEGTKPNADRSEQRPAPGYPRTEGDLNTGAGIANDRAARR